MNRVTWPMISENTHLGRLCWLPPLPSQCDMSRSSKHPTPTVTCNFHVPKYSSQDRLPDGSVWLRVSRGVTRESRLQRWRYSCHDLPPSFLGIGKGLSVLWLPFHFPYLLTVFPTTAISGTSSKFRGILSCCARIGSGQDIQSTVENLSVHK